MNWQKVKLKDLLDSFSVRAKDINKIEKLDFFGVSNDMGIIKTKYAAEDKAEEYKIIEKGCFAYNPYRINVGSIGLFDEDIRGLISPAYVVFKTKPNSIKPELLLKFLKSSEGLRQIKLYARGTVRQALRFEDLCKIEISIPDFEEQESLIKTLIHKQSFAQNLSSAHSSQLDLIKKIRKQILSDAMRGKLVPQNPDDEPASELLKRIKTEKTKLGKKEKPLPEIKPEEIPFEIPENWSWCRLGEVAYIASGSTPNQDAFVSEGIPYLKMYNLRNQKIDFEYKPQYIKVDVHNGQLKRSRTEIGDVIMNIVGPPLGKLAIIPDSLPHANFNQAAVLIRPFLIKKMNKWIFWYLNEMSEINSIVTKGVAGQDNISISQSNAIKIPLPPLSEQQCIVSKIDELMTLCDALEVNVKNNQEYVQMLYKEVLREGLQSNTGSKPIKSA